MSAYQPGDASSIKTYVIDVLKQEVANSLALVLGAILFENPNVLKLLHGCLTSDISWMVRDFGLKLVSTFDTQEFHKKYISNKELSLASFWEKYCAGLAQIELSEKKELQTSDWKVRPLRQDQLDYAANDTYFLLHIAFSQLRQVTSDKPDANSTFSKWYEEWCTRANKISYRTKQQDFDPKEAYRKHFKKLIDFYDQSDEYLQCELVFREIFNLREVCAERIDINREVLIPNEAVLILAR